MIHELSQHKTRLSNRMALRIHAMEKIDALEQKVRYSLLERIIRNLRDCYQAKK